MKWRASRPAHKDFEGQETGNDQSIVQRGQRDDGPAVERR
jgi:hypothetical protein